MANSIGPGSNYFNQINQQIAKGPDSKTAENLRQTGGTAASQRKSQAPRSKGVPGEGGLQLSEAAKKSLQASHQEHIEGHEHELAQQAGLQELETEGHESHELRVKRGHERDQEEKAEQADGADAPLPAGYVVVKSGAGADQVLSPDQVETLQALDDVSFTDRSVLGDIPQANLEAAERVVDTQLKDGAKKVAQLKPVPEAQDAGRMVLDGADFLGEPLDIREPGNDRSLPMTMEFPDSMTEIAHERAAAALANGELTEENLVA